MLGYSLLAKLPNRLLQFSLSKIFAFVIAPQLAFFALAYLTDNVTLINILNSVMLSLSIGVCVTYTPATFKVLTSPWPLLKADVLIVGIWLSWFASSCLMLYSIYWRYTGYQMLIANSDVNSYIKYTYCCAAICHLLGSGAVGGRNVPSEQLARIGGFVAAVVLASIGIIVVLSQLSFLSLDVRSLLIFA